MKALQVIKEVNKVVVGKEEQVRLARVYKELADKGCYVMLSNHNTTLVKELYKEIK